MSCLNLIPTEVRLIQQKRNRKNSIIALAVLSLLIIGSINGSYFYVIYKKSVENRALESRIAGLSNIEGETRSINEQKKAIQYRIEAYEKITDEEIHWTDILKHISSIMPGEVSINKLEASGEGISINGVSTRMESIAVFLANLENSHVYESVYMHEIIPDARGYGFSISLKLKDDMDKGK